MKVVPFNPSSDDSAEVEKKLEEAKEKGFKGVIVIGFDDDGYMHTSVTGLKTDSAIYAAEVFKALCVDKALRG